MKYSLMYPAQLLKKTSRMIPLSRLLPHAGLLIMVVFSGCATTQDYDSWAEPRSLGSDITSYQPSRDRETAPANLVEATGIITLSKALALALVHNPKLEGFSSAVRAAEARTLQSGLLPNPVVGVQAAQVGGSGRFQDYDSAETTIILSQLIELGGKRSARLRVAGLDQRLAGWDYEAKRLDVLTTCTRFFVGLLAAQQRLELAEESIELTEKVLNTVSIRVEAGKASPIEETKAEVALSLGRIALRNARQEVLTLRKRLAGTWGSNSPRFEAAGGDFETIRPVPAFAGLSTLVHQNPDLERWIVELQKRRASVELENAKRWPDLTLSGGVTRFDEGRRDEHAFTLGFSIPFPLFDHNQGGILESTHLLSRAEAEYRAALVQAQVNLTDAHEILTSSYAAANALKNEVLPGAKSVFASVVQGYEKGKFAYLDVLDAQRTMLLVRGQYIDSLRRYHEAMADVERLVGETLHLPESGQGAEQGNKSGQ